MDYKRRIDFLIKKLRRLTSLGLFLVTLSSPSLLAQDKVELGFSLGSSSYMGDLNPTNPIYQPNLSGAVIGRYVFNDRIAFKATAFATSLQGSYPSKNVFLPRTDGVSYLPDSIPNYSFYRPLVGDISGQVEINFQSYDHPYISTTTFTPYIAIGLGTTIYKRFSQQGSNQVEKSVFVLSLPIGLGIKYKLNKHIRLGAEWSFRKVFANDLDQPSANSVITPSDPYGFKQPSNLINHDWISSFQVSITFNMLKRRIGCNAGYTELN